ncbi:MAG: leucine-rich repeat domain-containing protein [Clostridiales bacterium]|nr:leucine-rich repeat domain-containing protein [Clostridiales bacterium]
MIYENKNFRGGGGRQRHRLKRLCAMLVSVIMILSCVPPVTLWADGNTSGYCGENAYWEITDGVMTVTGTGEIEYYDDWQEDTITKLVIGEGITSIGYEVFSILTNLTEISFPSTLEEISYWAFDGCTSLETVDLSGTNLTALYYGAFYGCTSLKSVSLPSTLEAFDKPFDGCTSLAEITTAEGGEYFYAEDNVLFEKYTYTDEEDNEVNAVTIALYPEGKTDGEYTIPDGVTGIDEDTFAGNTYLKNVTVPSSVEYIDGWAFENCSNLETVTLIEGLTHIGDSAFSGCTSLTSITIPSTVKTIDLYAFYGCTSLSEVNLSEGLEYLGYAVFSDCESLTSIYIPSTVTAISEYAFSGCSALAEITVSPENETYSTVGGVLMDTDQTEIIFYPNSLTATTFEIPASVTYIDSGAFASNTHLAEITVAEGNEAYCGIDGVLLNIDCTEIICYPTGKTSASYSIPDGVTGINEYMFAYNTYLTSVTVPSSVNYIDGWAFYYCTNLKTITLSEGLSHIGDSAFWGCENLTSITIPSTVNTLDLHAFVDCTSLKEIYIPNGVNGLYNELFSGCSSLTTVYLPSSINRIDDNVFSGCDSLTYISYDGTEDSWNSLSIGDGNDALNNASFTYSTFDWNIENEVLYITGSGSMPDYSEDDNNRAPWYNSYDQFNSVVIEDGITSIGSFAFDGSGTVETITINGSIRSIGNAAFRGSAITSITLPDSLKSIGDYSFQSCNNLTTFNIPVNVSSVESRAFVTCQNLESITVDENNSSFCSENGILYNKDMTRIYATGMANPNITNLVIPDSVSYISKDAFEGCSAIETLIIHEEGSDAYIYLANNAFAGCENLKSADIYGTTYELTSWLFTGCTGLESVTIPTSVNNIRAYAFENCSSLKTVNYSGSEDDWNGINIYEGNEYLTNAYETGDITYTIENGVLTISGTGRMPNYDNDENRAPWADSYDDVTSIVIESGVTSIGDNAFNNSWSVESISIADTVKSIGSGAFISSGLKSITFPNSVTSIGSYAFQYCNGLTTVNIPASVTDIEDCVFCICANLETITVDEDSESYCSVDGVLYTKDMTRIVACGVVNPNVTNFVLPDTVEYIASNAFIGCSTIETFTIPEGLSYVYIGECAFGGCENLVSADMYSGNEIAIIAFNGCTSLTTVTIPTSLTYVGESAFDGCDRLTTVYYEGTEDDWDSINIEGYNDPLTNAYNNTITAEISWSVDEYGVLTVSGTGKMPDYDDAGDAPWYDDKDSITSIVVEEGITSLGNNAFNSLYNASSVSLPSTLRTICGTAFENCSSLTAIDIPEKVKGIAERAFEGCTGLTSITIPAATTSIGSSAFLSCTSLASIEVSEDSQSYCSVDGVLFNKDMTDLHTYPAGKAAQDYEVPSTVGKILDSAFCKSTVQKVTLPDGLYCIEQDAFAVSAITSINIPSTLTEAGADNLLVNILRDCYSLESITVDEGNELFSSEDGIGFNADMTQLQLYPAAKLDVTSYSVPDSVTSVGRDSFANNSFIETVVLPESVTEIDSAAFYNCSSLTTVTLPSGLTSVGDDAFGVCSSITTVIYNGDSWNDISFGGGNDYLINAYANVNLKWDITDDVLTIYTELSGGLSIPNYTGDNHAPWYDYYDGEEKEVKTIVVDSSITAIGDYAFTNSQSVESVVIQGDITSIGNFAFQGCHISSLNLPASLTSIGSFAFQSCIYLTSIELPENLTYLGDGAFDDCKSLAAITVADGNTSFCSDENGLIYTIDMTEIVACGTANPNVVNLVIPNTVKYVRGAFNGNPYIQTITIAEGASDVVIGGWNFSNLENLVSIDLTGVTQLEGGTFYNCSSLKNITLPSSLDIFGDDDFTECTAIEKVYCVSGSRADDFSLYPDSNSVNLVYADSKAVRTSDDKVYLISGFRLADGDSLENYTKAELYYGDDTTAIDSSDTVYTGFVINGVEFEAGEMNCEYIIGYETTDDYDSYTSVDDIADFVYYELKPVSDEDTNSEAE